MWECGLIVSNFPSEGFTVSVSASLWEIPSYPGRSPTVSAPSPA